MARISLSTHWKFQRLSRALGSKVLARGVLETLWEPCWVAGDAYVGTAADIEALCEWKGEAGALTKALLMEDAKSAGFIEPYQGRVRTTELHYQIHDFLHHCPEYVRARRERHLNLEGVRACAVCGDEIFRTNSRSMYCSERCKQAAFRDRHVARNRTDGYANVTPTVTDDDLGTDASVTDRNRRVTVRYGNNSVTVTNGDPNSQNSEQKGLCNRERNRCNRALYSTVQEDSSTPDLRSDTTAERKTARAATVTPTVTNPSSNPPDLELEPEAAQKPPAAPRKRATHVEPPSTSPVVLTFPVVGEGGPWWYLREDQIGAWQALYPNLSVIEEARKALAWITADHQRRKHAGGMRKCLVAWFNRALDHMRARGPTQLAAPADPAPILTVWDTCPHKPICESSWRCAQRTALEEAKGTRWPRKDGQTA
jgi:hypothetical protein